MLPRIVSEFERRVIPDGCVFLDKDMLEFDAEVAVRGARASAAAVKRALLASRGPSVAASGCSGWKRWQEALRRLMTIGIPRDVTEVMATYSRPIDQWCKARKCVFVGSLNAPSQMNHVVYVR